MEKCIPIPLGKWEERFPILLVPLMLNWRKCSPFHWAYKFCIFPSSNESVIIHYLFMLFCLHFIWIEFLMNIIYEYMKVCLCIIYYGHYMMVFFCVKLFLYASEQPASFRLIMQFWKCKFQQFSLFNYLLCYTFTCATNNL